MTLPIYYKVGGKTILAAIRNTYYGVIAKNFVRKGVIWR